MRTMTYGTVPERADFVEAAGEIVPFEMVFRGRLEWEAMVQAINQGIDSHLEAIQVEEGPEGKLTIKDAESLHTLVRRLTEIHNGEGPARGRYGAPTEYSDEEYRDEAGAIAGDILCYVNIEWV